MILQRKIEELSHLLKEYAGKNNWGIDDRVEIENTGHLPNELTTETIKLPHRSNPQNPIIVDALYMTALLESWGTGVSRMVAACKAVGLTEPEYGTDGGFVWIIFGLLTLSPALSLTLIIEPSHPLT